MAGVTDPNGNYLVSGVDPAQYGPTPAPSLAVSPPPFDPNNPLGLNASAPGYLPADMRAPQVDPDLNISGGLTSNTGPPIAQPNFTPEQLNALQQPLIDWGNMDEAYWKPREQNPLPLVLGALGAIAAPFALSALGVGAGLGGAGAGAGAAGAGTAGALGAGTAAGAGALGAGAAGAAGTVSELVVTAAAQGLGIPAIAASLGIPAATVSSILSSSGGGTNTLTGNAGGDTVPVNEVSPLTVTPAASSGVSQLAVAAPAALGTVLAGAGSGGFDPNSLGVGDVTQPSVAPATPPKPQGLVDAINSGDVSNIGDWIKANPLQAASLGLLAAGTVGAGATGSGGSYNIPSGDGAPGTLSSLNPIFSAGLPAPSTPMRTQRPLPQGIDWNRYAIQGPAQSFFSNVPQAQPAQFTVPSVSQIQQQGADNLGVADLAALRRKFAGPGYAKGGRMDFAVHGAGDGRSDSIPARLSDGEYVMDAETVSMLGDGSSAAGAKKLDRMRVNLRKAKGKQLARGRFSVSAKAPESYMSGGSV